MNPPPQAVATGRTGARRARAWVLAVLAAACGGVARSAPEVPEVELKAAFLFHFTQFVVWSERDFPGPNGASGWGATRWRCGTSPGRTRRRAAT
jgi:hypothetical protein